MRSRLLINGYKSQGIKIQKSVKENSPLYMILIVIILNPFLEKLTKELQGKKIINKTITVLVYADVMTILVRCEDENEKVEKNDTFCKSLEN